MRKPRQLESDARYHVTARANHREMLLDPREAKALFLKTISRAKEKYKFSIENFSILGNHFHLVVHVPQGSNLSKIMKWILGVFAMAWNRIHQAWGHFWGDRFFSRLLTTEADYASVSHYVDQNPVAAGLVAQAEDWPFGGLYFRTRGLRGILSRLPDWFDQTSGPRKAPQR